MSSRDTSEDKNALRTWRFNRSDFTAYLMCSCKCKTLMQIKVSSDIAYFHSQKTGEYRSRIIKRLAYYCPDCKSYLFDDGLDKLLMIYNSAQRKKAKFLKELSKKNDNRKKEKNNVNKKIKAHLSVQSKKRKS